MRVIAETLSPTAQLARPYLPKNQPDRFSGYYGIGHLGDLNELMLAGTLSGVEMGLELSGIPFKKGGVAAALQYLTEQART
jgi:hypothetical protein